MLFKESYLVSHLGKFCEDCYIGTKAAQLSTYQITPSSLILVGSHLIFSRVVLYVGTGKARIN
jgi:hypothetical protein